MASTCSPYRSEIYSDGNYLYPSRIFCTKISSSSSCFIIAWPGGNRAANLHRNKSLARDSFSRRIRRGPCARGLSASRATISLIDVSKQVSKSSWLSVSQSVGARLSRFLLHNRRPIIPRRSLVLCDFSARSRKRARFSPARRGMNFLIDKSDRL